MIKTTPFLVKSYTDDTIFYFVNLSLFLLMSEALLTQKMSSHLFLLHLVALVTLHRYRHPWAR